MMLLMMIFLLILSQGGQCIYITKLNPNLPNESFESRTDDNSSSSQRIIREGWLITNL